ncbi:PREDICTED: sperm flagellar protein 2-like [Polistes dominula]|uniref:Sperm flagellar protein 2-like n=1 Tax=Polistes dominula TaxID=743375 RepID=A0ABM1I1P6_POLDO|nr:PREDICTED: sperm flagellar protein 2-like [Polistes dominula]
MESIHVSMTLNDTKNDDISKEMNDFARKHRIKSSIKDIYYDPCSNDKIYEEIELYEENPDAAKAYVSWLKNRKKKDNIDNTVKSGIQNTLISELRKNLLENQEKCFDELLARRVLDQSHYEKQIITKLSEVLNQKNVMTENRRIVDELMLEAEENKKRLEQDRQREEYDWEYEEIDMEYRRLCELHCKIRQEKLNKLREKHERICREVLYDLIDIALKLSEYRSSNECSLPKAIWNEWKTLFLKCQPIFELFENEFSKEDDDDDDEEEEKEEEEEDIEEIVQSRLDREEILNEANFENYHTLQSPWDEYVPSTIDPEIEEILKLGELVLGYIVHRLLEFVYPYPSGPLESPVPKVKTAAIVLGIIEPRLYDSIEILLKNSDIRLVSMKDAINYCLLRYKEEMLDFEYIDANIIRATNDIMKNRKVDNLKNNTTTRSKKIHKSDQISLRRKEKLKEKDKGKGLKEKETQTPRVIPYDDMNPILSDAAHIGKWTYEFLILGQPISNELNTKIIIEYLKSLGEIEGWALIDYPNSYEQMIRLEFALTGHQISQHYVDSINVVEEFDKINIEDIDPVSSRIIYEDTEIDDYSIYRQSKLLPNPIIKKNDSTSTSTFMTTYVRVIPKPINLKVDPNKLVEILSDDVTPIDKFYIEQNIAYVVYYDHFDTNIIKKIVRLVIGDKSMPRTPSIELFGEDALKLLEEHEKRNYKEFSPKKSKIVERSVLSKEKEEEEKEEEKDKIKMKDDKVSDDHLDVHGVSTKPGEDGWKWLDLPINPILLDALATLWENLEEIYIFDLMEIFSLKRIHSMSVIPYKNFLTNNMMKFINRPDSKQNLLHEFQHMFNNVKDDTRNDDDVKCELHCRLIEFQNDLFDICDVKRLECEKERQRIIHENWTSFEAVILINIYLSIIQCEIDRFVDTIQLIQDYYTSMLEKSIKETRYSKILLDKLNIHDIKLQMNENMFDDSTTMINDKYIKDKIDRKDVKKSKNISDKFDFTKPVINVHNLIEEITNLFVNVANSTSNFDTNDSLIYKVINDNVNYVKQFVEFIATRANETMKKEENVSTGREKTRRKVDDEKLMRIKINDLFQEWKYAILFEINRIKMRLDVILGSAKVDVNFLLETMRLTFHQIYEKIIDRFYFIIIIIGYLGFEVV